LLSLKEARVRGVTRYFTGKPCKYGHVAERLVSNRRCSVCLALLRQQRGFDNPDKLGVREARYYRERPGYRGTVIANAARWAETNPEASRDAKARYREANKEVCVARTRRSRELKPDYYRELARCWRASNPDKNRAKATRYRARRANPYWADQHAVSAVYSACPPGAVVDHIVPLKGYTVEGYRISGLHIEENLQYLTPVENARKSNRMRLADQALCEGRV
jgi:hypothetical protein